MAFNHVFNTLIQRFGRTFTKATADALLVHNFAPGKWHHEAISSAHCCPWDFTTLSRTPPHNLQKEEMIINL